MSLFKAIFGSRGGDKGPAPRTLEHPRDLKVGDILKFGFTDQTDLGNQQFRVESIVTLDLGGDAKKKVVFNIVGTDQAFRIAVISDKGKEYVEVGRSVLPEDVEQIFDVEQFIGLLDPDTGVNHVLHRTGEPAYLEGWTGAVYRQEAGHNAYLYADDYRSRSLPTHESEGATGFSHYRLVTDDRQYALEVQVFDGGRTEVFLLANLAPLKIEEMWPAAG